MPARSGLNLLFQGLLLLALGACFRGADGDATAAPPGRSPLPPARTAKAPAPEVSQASHDLRRYYARMQHEQQAQGLLRTDGGGTDTPYTDTDLVRDFIAIAFYDEYSRGEGLIRAKNEAVGLTKWVQPVRVGLDFGQTVDDQTRQRSRAELSRYVARLAQATGHPISMVPRDGNFTVMVLGEDDRRDEIRRAARTLPDISPASLAALLDMPRDIHCLVVTFSRNERRSEIVRAVALIRAEHPPLSLQACIHEEVAQGLGLTNDSPRARPSIFNDDDEFALLTRHDEDLLRILYSPELQPGMSIEQSRVIVTRLAARMHEGRS